MRPVLWAAYKAQNCRCPVRQFDAPDSTAGPPLRLCLGSARRCFSSAAYPVAASSGRPLLTSRDGVEVNIPVLSSGAAGSIPAPATMAIAR